MTDPKTSESPPQDIESPAEEFDEEAGDGMVPDTVVKNEDLIPGAGKVPLDAPKSWGKGIISDVKGAVLAHWFKEMINFNQKTIAVTFLLFISVIAPTLAFGSVYGKVTEDHMGAVEMILGTAWVGMAYALIGGMPVCIMGSTGPLLAFTTVVYNLSKTLDVPFLSFNAWVSVWLLVYAFTASFFDLTRFVRLATRFTDDIFAFLIVCIFIMDAVGDPFSQVGVLRYLDPNHASHDQFSDNPNYNYMATGLLSVILFISTCGMTFFLRHFRYSSFFCGERVRESIFDFAVTISVLTVTLVRHLVFDELDVEGLKVPDTFEPTYACCDASCRTEFPAQCEDPNQAEAYGTRDWRINYFDLNGKGWTIVFAAVPAILAFFLCYLDNGITWHLINHKSHKLEHGESYNWDLLLSGVFNCVNGAFGLPWLVATTVPCIIHLHGLSTKDTKGKILKVQETRLTGFFAHMIMALCLLFLNVLKLLPMPVLYGVFLFMGLSSVGNIQFFQRILLFLQQPSKYPNTPYNTYMQSKRIHMYTVIQFLFFCGVFVVIGTPKIAIAFPLMTLACIPGRIFLLPRIFAGWELVLLDGEDHEIHEWVNAKVASMRAKQPIGKQIMDDDDESVDSKFEDQQFAENAFVF